MSWVRWARPWPTGVQSVTRTRGPTGVMGKRQNRKRLIRKFGFRIEVRSYRIDESSFCQKIILLYIRISYDFVVLDSYFLDKRTFRLPIKRNQRYFNRSSSIFGNIKLVVELSMYGSLYSIVLNSVMLYCIT